MADEKINVTTPLDRDVKERVERICRERYGDMSVANYLRIAVNRQLKADESERGAT